MSFQRGRRLGVIVLVFFALVTLSIDFFHTEAGHPEHEPGNCPACHFHSTSVSISPVACFDLPALIWSRLPVTHEAYRLADGPVLTLSSRSPPQA
jgi:hypothetical protein